MFICRSLGHPYFKSCLGKNKNDALYNFIMENSSEKTNLKYIMELTVSPDTIENLLCNDSLLSNSVRDKILESGNYGPIEIRFIK